MSKKHKGRTCVYCAMRPSTTADHVVARQFFLEHERDYLPTVPACAECNNEKSKLEHYLTVVLAFGAKHRDALRNLSTMVPKRLQRNAKLLAELRAGIKKGEYVSIPIRNGELERLFGFIARGLAWYHWEVLLGAGYSVRAATITEAGTALLDRILSLMTPQQRTNGSVGKDSFAYEGYQAVDCPEFTIWRLRIYGGLQLGGDPALPSEKASEVVVITGPDGVVQRIGTALLGMR